MRNLKKILALVLALVMSLSLMATAGAADATAANSETIAAEYQTAVDVLKGVKVFNGYQDGTFKPQQTITRAEVAAILYRIATGDVADAKKDIYTDMANVNFTDLAGANWAKGYINYCANAQLIVGMGDGSFHPSEPIKGYAVLAMVLRALGYDKNNEFKGTGWEIRTAAQARELGILKNVTGDLGSDATREMVAEILFRAILNEIVTYSPINQNGYLKTGETLAKKNLGLEEVEGVVVANEWANLYDVSVIGAGKTNLEVAEDDIRTLNEGTGLQDVGMSKLVYTQTDARNTYKVIKIADSGKNTVKETGAATDISNGSKFAKNAEMPAASDIEYYVNFGRTGKYTCDYRLEFSVTFEATANATAAEVKAAFENRYVDGSDLVKDVGMTKTPNEETYSKIIRADDEIYQKDLDVIRGIFAAADNGENNNIYQGIDGYVYAGTKSNPTIQDRSNDLSDTISYRTFLKDYLNDETFDISWETSENGEWVKFIDNDADGYADYAFKTEFGMDKITTTYKKGEDTKYIFHYLDEELVGFDWLYDSPAVGDIVLYFEIDGVAHINLAEYDTDVVRTVSYKEDSITLESGTTRYQSGIFNKTALLDKITDVDEKVEYNLYRDYFDYVRLYEETAGAQYALVTEAYYTNHNASAFIQNWPVTVELTVGEEDTKEYNLANRTDEGAAFVSGDVWTQINGRNGTYFDNYLQPATSGLTPTVAANSTWNARNRSTYTYWDWNESVHSQQVPVMDEVIGPFDFGAQMGVTDHSASFTNVARYTMSGDDSVNLFSASKLRVQYDNHNYYATDYIQLNRESIGAGQRQYNIGGTSEYKEDNNYVVNAVHDTQYYIVSENGVYYFTDYANVPAINANTAGAIHAAYAVARNISSDNDELPYWVADVVVFEVESWDPAHFDSIALGYFLATKTTGEVQSIEALDNATDDPKVTIVPGNRRWTNTQAQAEGFFKVYDQELSEDKATLTASKIVPITSNYNANGIYASIADRVYTVNERGAYITVEDIIPNRNNIVDLAEAYYISGKNAKLLTVFDDYNSTVKSDIQKGDALIWVMAPNGRDTAFIVNLGSADWLYGATPIETQSVDPTKLDWLWNLWIDIVEEEENAPLSAAQKIQKAEEALEAFKAAAKKPDSNLNLYIPSLADAYNLLLTIKNNDAGVSGKVWEDIQSLKDQLLAAIDAAAARVLEAAEKAAEDAINANDELSDAQKELRIKAAQAALAAAKAAVVAAATPADKVDAMNNGVDAINATIDKQIGEEEPPKPEKPEAVTITMQWAIMDEAGTKEMITGTRNLAAKPLAADANSVTLTAEDLAVPEGDLYDAADYTVGSVTVVTPSTGITYTDADKTLSGTFPLDGKVTIKVQFVMVEDPDAGDDSGDEGGDFGGIRPHSTAAQTLSTGDRSTAKWWIYAKTKDNISPDEYMGGTPRGMKVLDIEYLGKYPDAGPSKDKNYWEVTFDTSALTAAVYDKYFGDGATVDPKVNFTSKNETPTLPDDPNPPTPPTPDETLEEARASATKAINDAEAEMLAKPNMAAEQRNEIKALAVSARWRVSKDGGLTTVAEINAVLPGLLKAIRAVKPTDRFGPQNVNVPSIYEDSSMGLMYYYIEDAETKLTKESLLKMLQANKNEAGVTFTEVLSLVDERLDANNGMVYVDYPLFEGNRDAQNGWPWAVVLGTTKDGEVSRWTISLARVYKITVNGELSGYVTGGINYDRDADQFPETSVMIPGEAVGTYLERKTLAQGPFADAYCEDPGDPDATVADLVSGGWNIVEGDLRGDHNYVNNNNTPLALVVTPHYDPNDRSENPEPIGYTYSYADKDFVTAYLVQDETWRNANAYNGGKDNPAASSEVSAEDFTRPMVPAKDGEGNVIPGEFAPWDGNPATEGDIAFKQGFAQAKAMIISEPQIRSDAAQYFVYTLNGVQQLGKAGQKDSLQTLVVGSRIESFVISSLAKDSVIGSKTNTLITIDGVNAAVWEKAADPATETEIPGATIQAPWAASWYVKSGKNVEVATDIAEKAGTPVKLTVQNAIWTTTKLDLVSAVKVTLPTTAMDKITTDGTTVPAGPVYIPEGKTIVFELDGMTAMTVKHGSKLTLVPATNGVVRYTLESGAYEFEVVEDINLVKFATDDTVENVGMWYSDNVATIIANVANRQDENIAAATGIKSVKIGEFTINYINIDGGWSSVTGEGYEKLRDYMDGTIVPADSKYTNLAMSGTGLKLTLILTANTGYYFNANVDLTAATDKIAEDLGLPAHTDLVSGDAHETLTVNVNFRLSGTGGAGGDSELVDAKVAAMMDIGSLLTVLEGAYTEQDLRDDATVGAKITALENAIKACTTVEELEEIYASGAFVPENEDVKALTDAVLNYAKTNIGTAATEAVDAAKAITATWTGMPDSLYKDSAEEAIDDAKATFDMMIGMATTMDDIETAWEYLTPKIDAALRLNPNYTPAP